MEICQRGIQVEWQLFIPSPLELPGLIVLLNPPADPFCQAFIQAGEGLDEEELYGEYSIKKHLYGVSIIREQHLGRREIPKRGMG